MDYIEIINDSIEYIESNLESPITIDELSGRYYISRYYFYRMFRALTNKTVKEYMDERRLTEAAKRIRTTDQNIIDIAFDLGFESHEVFSRSFKRHFSITPVKYRNSYITIPMFEKIVVVERDFKNLNSDLVVDYKIKHLGPLSLVGWSMEFNPNNPEEIEKTSSVVAGFVNKYVAPENLDTLYNITRTDTVSGENISYFTGYHAKHGNPGGELCGIEISESDYAVFKYYGGMQDIHNTVFEDICKVLAVSGISHTKIDIDFIEIYPHDFFKNHGFYIYVPITG